MKEGGKGIDVLLSFFFSSSLSGFKINTCQVLRSEVGTERQKILP